MKLYDCGNCGYDEYDDHEQFSEGAGEHIDVCADAAERVWAIFDSFESLLPVNTTNREAILFRIAKLIVKDYEVFDDPDGRMTPQRTGTTPERSNNWHLPSSRY